jgi:hypothetical protein
MAEHPAKVASRWVDAFLGPALQDTLYAKQLVRPLYGLWILHTFPMPWKVRLYVLVTGRIPLSYLENFDAHEHRPH